MGIGHPEIEHARIEMANLLGWLQALLDRLERQPRRRGQRRLGLIPSIAPDYPLRHRLEELQRDLTAVLDEPQLRNFTIHSSTIPHANAGARLMDGERIVFSIPDRPASPVYLFDQFTWENGRELRSFCSRRDGRGRSLHGGLSRRARGESGAAARPSGTLRHRQWPDRHDEHQNDRTHAILRQPGGHPRQGLAYHPPGTGAASSRSTAPTPSNDGPPQRRSSLPRRLNRRAGTCYQVRRSPRIFFGASAAGF